MPNLRTISKLQPAFRSSKRFIVIIGGRGSGKSIAVTDLAIMRAQAYRQKVLCCREFQNSISDSMYSLINSEVERLGVEGFTSTNNEITHDDGGHFIFRGLARNPESIKSMSGVNLAIVEEAQTISETSLKILTPTIREPGSQLIFIGNPRSSEDAFSKKFINPYLPHLQRDGYYEDELHLIITCNWRDNPYFPEELDKERKHDYQTLSRAMYRHIWEGEHLDEVENSLIKPEWFDACIDAHKKRNLPKRGAKFVSHDPADVGDDAGGYAARHGIVFEDIREYVDGDGNQGCDWACDLAIAYGADYFNYDADGMGALLRKQIDENFGAKKVEVSAFKGSMSPDRPDAMYGDKTNKQSFKNMRAQFYTRLKDRIYKTYRVIEHGDFIDPDELISFSSEIENMDKLRAEVCRIPLKPTGTGLIQIMPKPEMKRLGINSPNMADSVMMCLFEPVTRLEETEITFEGWA